MVVFGRGTHTQCFPSVDVFLILSSEIESGVGCEARCALEKSMPKA